MEPEDSFDITRVTFSKLRRSSAQFATPQPPPHIEDDTPRAHYASAPAFRPPPATSTYDPTLLQELPNMVLLVVLYMMQGVPLGLTMGSMPLLLASKASYTQIGIFSVASYPYSFKLLWSPIVDALHLPAFGRRKSWIVPLQLASAALMFSGAPWAEARLGAGDVQSVTSLFFFLVLLAATQDIAVDGWALTLLSRRHVGYAATCQTIGMNMGYFTSFTVFLALNDADFANAHLRPPAAASDVGVLSLAAYLKFWAAVYAAVTVAVWLFKAERPRLNGAAKHENGGSAGGDADEVAAAYSRLWGVVRLPAVLRLSAVLVTCRLGFLAAEAAAPLKLLEKGVSKESLAGLVILQVPCELLSALVAGRWAAAASPFAPWRTAYGVRLAAALLTTALVARFPPDAASIASHPFAFLSLAAVGLATSFSSTLMFTALGSFYNRVSDPDMGGAYLTMLNTIANIGITLPKIAVFALMDALSANACEDPETGAAMARVACPRNYQASQQPNACTEAGGTCVAVRDGFYATNALLVVLGAVLFLHFRRALPVLEGLPLESWRVKALHHA